MEILSRMCFFFFSNQQNFTNVTADSAPAKVAGESEIKVMATKSESSICVSSNGTTSHPKKGRRSTESTLHA